MEKDILNIINSKDKKKIDKSSSKDIAVFFNDLDKLDKERTKSTKYNNEVSKLVKTC